MAATDPHDKASRPDDAFSHAVKTRRDRTRRAHHEGERSLARNLALAGSLGWLIVLPALVGAALGRALDHRFGGGVTFTAASLACGVAWGMYMAWQRMKEA